MLHYRSLVCNFILTRAPAQEKHIGMKEGKKWILNNLILIQFEYNLHFIQFILCVLLLLFLLLCYICKLKDTKLLN